MAPQDTRKRGGKQRRGSLGAPRGQVRRALSEGGHGHAHEHWPEGGAGPAPLFGYGAASFSMRMLQRLGSGSISSSSSSAIGATRLLSLEFSFYYVSVGFFMYLLMTTCVYMSAPFNEGHEQLRGLKPGWIAGRLIDLRDYQFAEFRSNLPLLLLAGAGHVAASKLFRRAVGARPGLLMVFHCVAGLVAQFVLSGSQSLFVLAECLLSFSVAKLAVFRRIRRAVPLLSWALGIAYIFVNARYGGSLSFRRLHTDWGWLDRYKGLTRWHQHFNLSVLRILSFMQDFVWARDEQPVTAGAGGGPVSFTQHAHGCVHCSLHGQKAPCLWWREKEHCGDGDYSFVAFLAYVLYPPLYLGGPILSFNAFASQVREPQRSYSGRGVVRYGVRWLLVLLLLEAGLHYCYMFAISHGNAWLLFNRLQIMALVWGTLMLMWLKFMVIWRFFRLWALCDGVEAPENMTRCIMNVYSLADFWRSWHRSFNRWLVRYIYVPLGGETHVLGAYDVSGWPLGRLLARAANIFLVFTFVAIWHDQSLQLLAWGWIIALLFVPELVLGYVTRSFRHSGPFRYAKGLAAGVNILLTCLANLVGYNIGVSGVARYVGKLVTLEGVPFLLSVIFMFAMQAQIQFEVRRFEEKRRALDKEHLRGKYARELEHEAL